MNRQKVLPKYILLERSYLFSRITVSSQSTGCTDLGILSRAEDTAETETSSFGGDPPLYSIGSSSRFCLLNWLPSILLLTAPSCLFSYNFPSIVPIMKAEKDFLFINYLVPIVKAEKDLLFINYLASLHLFSSCLKNYSSPHTLSKNMETCSNRWEN